MAALLDKVTDSTTGFTGTVTARTEYSTGIARCGVEALVDGKPVMEWFDEARLLPAS